MENKICQSCSMPMIKKEEFGTNKDFSTNNDYCIYCFKNGEFVDKVNMEEYIEMNVQFASQTGMTEDEMREHCRKIFPTLKRWQNNVKL